MSNKVSEFFKLKSSHVCLQLDAYLIASIFHKTQVKLIYEIKNIAFYPYDNITVLTDNNTVIQELMLVSLDPNYIRNLLNSFKIEIDKYTKR